MRVATIDIGTNTTLLLVAERDASGVVRAVREEAVITRLGQGVDVARKLAPEAIARTNACLGDYARIVRELGVERVAVVGTSAMRDAGGGDEIRTYVRERFGIEARTISGDEEARLTFAGALSGMKRADGDAVVFDIGGGSTEIVVGAIPITIRAAHSFDVGSVRMTERHIRSDPPSADDLARVRSALRETFAKQPSLLEDARRVEAPPVGIAGTVTTLAAIAMSLVPYDGGRVHGYVMTLAAVDDVIARLASVPLAARRTIPGLEPKRADVIVCGALIVRAILETLEAREMLVSDRGVRWGLAEELLGGFSVPRS